MLKRVVGRDVASRDRELQVRQANFKNGVITIAQVNHVVDSRLGARILPFTA